MYDFSVSLYLCTSHVYMNFDRIEKCQSENFASLRKKKKGKDASMDYNIC